MAGNYIIYSVWCECDVELETNEEDEWSPVGEEAGACVKRPVSLAID